MRREAGVELIRERAGAGEQHGGHREAIDRAMVAMAGRRALGPEGEHDLRPLAAEQGDDLADDDVRIRGGERAVRMSAVIDRARCRARAHAPRAAPRGGCVPAPRETKRGCRTIVRHPRRWQSRASSERPRSAYFAIVPPVANVSSSGCAKTAVSERVTRVVSCGGGPPSSADDREEEVEQVEVDVHRGRHVVIGPVLPRAHDAPRVEHQQAAEHQHRAARDPQRCRARCRRTC